jgi:hypothetical protein
VRRALAAGLLFAACATAPLPTPRSPAPELQGYRAKTPQGVDLVFDSKLQLFAVPASPGAYWLDGRYFRRTGSSVDCAARLEGPWAPCPAGELPERLR